MAFDRNKVNWTNEELDAAEEADKIYEAVRPVFEGDFNYNKLIGAVGAIFGSVLALFRFLSDGSRDDFVSKWLAIGHMLERDNNWIDLDDEGPSPG